MAKTRAVARLSAMFGYPTLPAATRTLMESRTQTRPHFLRLTL